MDFIFIRDLPFGVTLRIEQGFVGGSEGSPLFRSQFHNHLRSIK
jgi:hypothetical protein